MTANKDRRQSAPRKGRISRATDAWTNDRARARRSRAPLVFVLLAILNGGCALHADENAAKPQVAAGQAPPSPVGQPETPPSNLLSAQTSIDQDAVRRGRAIVIPGTGSFVAPADVQPAHVQSAAGGGITFAFNGLDVREVARELLGEQLHLPYVVDPKANAPITAQTGGPLRREDVLPTLEAILSANGLAMIEDNGVWRIMPMQDAARATLSAPMAAQPGYGIRILPLKYVSAPELKGVLAPVMPQGSTLETVGARNVLVVAGPASELGGLADLVRRFDVDWLASTSFALYPLHVAQAKDVAPELQAIFGDGASGPLAGLVRVVPIDRLNAILVIAAEPKYLVDVRQWIDRFDYGEDETTPRMFEYRVQNSRAADIAAVLNKLLGAGAVSTVQPATAPGTSGVAIGGGGAPGIGVPPGGIGPGAYPMGLSGQPSGTSLPGATGITGLGTAPPAQPGMATGALPSTAPPGGTGARPGSLSEALEGTFGAPNEAQGELPLPQARVVADEKNNAIVVYAKPRDYRMIERVIHQLDVVPLQVEIEATIAEVTLNDQLQYGVQWFLSHASNKFEFTAPPPGVSTVTTTSAGTGTAADILPSFPGFDYVLGGGQGKLVLSALSDVTHVDVVSAPHLVVLDHQTAYLQVGDEVPTVTASAVSTLTSTAPIVNSVQYIGTGVILQVTPRVNNSGLVTLDIDQSVSDVTTTTTSTIDSPTISQRHINTTVTVQGGETVALGGLITDNRTVSNSGIPILKDIPVLGALFGERSNTKARTELLVLLTPRILRDQRDATAATDELREEMRDLKPLESRAR
ncbi:MAG TPA: type II secretion system secretin GspD [Stellaceae bacterium]|nr:type II secretion system secretin GspD [Stellaceae bacterium]